MRVLLDLVHPRPPRVLLDLVHPRPARVARVLLDFLNLPQRYLWDRRCHPRAPRVQLCLMERLARAHLCLQAAQALFNRCGQMEAEMWL